MKDFLKKHWLLLLGLFIIFGGIFNFRAAFSGTSVFSNIISGVLFVIAGIGLCILYIMKRESDKPSSKFSVNDKITEVFENNLPGPLSNVSGKKGCGCITAIVVLFAFVFTGLGSCGGSGDIETTTSVFNDVELSIFSYNQDVELEIGETEKGNLDVDFDEDELTLEYIKENLVFKSSDESIAKIYASDKDSTMYIPYEIEAVGEGTATLYIETSDGIVKSDEITITVSAPETTSTTEETTEIKTTEKETTTINNITTTEEEYEEIIETTKKSSGRTVYVTPNGERYHYSSDCAGDNGRAVSMDEVGSRTPCKKCAQ